MNNKYPIIGVVLIILIAGLTIFQKNKITNKIIKEDRKVIGKVFRFQYSNYNYILHYEYVVGGIRYEKSVSTSFFKCNDGKDGCVDKEFVIYYSSKEPNNSIIDLGQYNKYKGY
jgi:hypothetical protein